MKDNEDNNIKKIIYSKKNQGNLKPKKYIKKQNVPPLDDFYFDMFKLNENNNHFPGNCEKNSEKINDFLKNLSSKNNIVNSTNDNDISLGLSINNLFEYFILFHHFLSFLSSNNIIKHSIKKNEMDSILSGLIKKKNNINTSNMTQCRSEPNTLKRKNKFYLENNYISNTTNNNYSPVKKSPNSLPFKIHNKNNSKNILTIKDNKIDKIINDNNNNKKYSSRESSLGLKNSKNLKQTFKIEDNKTKDPKNDKNNNNFEIKVNKSKCIPNKEHLIMIKIKELNDEVLKFKEEHKKIMGIKEEYEKLQKQLMEDIENFNLKKENFEDYMNKEREKLQKERKNFIKETKFLNDLKQENKSLHINNKINQKKIKTLSEKIIELEEVIEKDKIKVKTNTKNKTDNKKIMTNYKTESNININKKKKNNYYYIKKNYFDGIERSSATLINSDNFVLKKDSSKFFSQTSPCSKYSSKPLSKNNSISKNNFTINKNSLNCYNNYNKNIITSTRNNEKINYKSNSINNFSNLNQNRFNIRVKKNINKNMKYKLFNDTNSIRDIHCSIMKNNDIQKIKLPISNSTRLVKQKQINSFDIKNATAKKEISDIIKNMNCVNNINNIITNSVNSINNNLFNSNPEIKIKSYLDEDDNYDFVIPEKYSNSNKYKLLESFEKENGQIINLYSNNKKEIIFKSGLKKEIYDDGNYKLVFFPNGDKKQCFKNIGKIVYYFNDAKTVQTSYKNGLNVFKFSNNQIEKHFTDGSKLIILPDGTQKMMQSEKVTNIIDISGAEDEIINNFNLNNDKDINTKETVLSDLFFNIENEI